MNSELQHFTRRKTIREAAKRFDTIPSSLACSVFQATIILPLTTNHHRHNAITANCTSNSAAFLPPESFPVLNVGYVSHSNGESSDEVLDNWRRILAGPCLVLLTDFLTIGTKASRPSSLSLVGSQSFL